MPKTNPSDTLAVAVTCEPCSTEHSALAPILPVPPRRWLSQNQAAEYIGVTDRTLRNWVRSGAIKAHRVRGSRLIRYDRAELDAALRPIPAAGGGRLAS